MIVLIGPVLLLLFVAAAACAIASEVIALTSPSRLDFRRRLLDPAAVLLFIASVVLFVLRLRHYS